MIAPIADSKKKAPKLGEVKYSDIFKRLQQELCYKENIFHDVEFWPAPEMIHRDRKFNLFQGFKQKPIAPDPTKVHRGLEKVLFHLFRVIANNDTTCYEYLLNWFAHALQRPHKKIGVVPILLGAQGIGKNIIIDFIGKFIYGNMYLMLNSLDTLMQQFNGFLANKLLIVLNEIQTFGGSYKDADKIKSYITEDERMKQIKYQESTKITVMENFIMMTNNDWPMRIEADDRRWAPMRVSDEFTDNKKYFDELGAELTADTAAHFMGFLLARNISEWNPRAIPATKLRTEMKELSVSAPVRFCIDIAKREHLAYAEMDPVRDSVKGFYSEFISWCGSANERYSGTNRSFAADIAKVNLTARTIRLGEGAARCSGYLVKLAELQDSIRKFLKDPTYSFMPPADDQ